MDRYLDVRTPESIAFSYELAGLGSRALAVLLDLLVQVGLLALLLWGLFFAGSHLGSVPKASPAPDRFVTNLAIGFLIAVVFAIFFGYFILFEALWNGQTPGKRALGIRVVRDGGFPMDWGAALIRNVVRVGEVAFGAYALAAVCAVLSPESKRFGDIAAGTIVVRDVAMAIDLPALERERQPTYAATGFVSGEERELIHRFIERREQLTRERRAHLAARLAERVRPRVPFDLQRLDDEALLERL